MGGDRLETTSARLLRVSLHSRPSLPVFLLPGPSLPREPEASASTHSSPRDSGSARKNMGWWGESEAEGPRDALLGASRQSLPRGPWALTTRSDTDVHQVIQTPGQKQDGKWRGSMGKGTEGPPRRQTLLAAKRTSVNPGWPSRLPAGRVCRGGTRGWFPQRSCPAAWGCRSLDVSGGFCCGSRWCLVWTEQEGQCGGAHPRTTHTRPTCPQPGRALLSLPAASLVHPLGRNPRSSVADHPLSELALRGAREC